MKLLKDVRVAQMPGYCPKDPALNILEVFAAELRPINPGHHNERESRHATNNPKN